MAFSTPAITDVLATAPADAFNCAGSQQIREWDDYVISKDPSPAAKHDVFHYGAVARLLAEIVGSVSPSDFEDPRVREMIKDAITAGALPCAGETDDKWKILEVFAGAGGIRTACAGEMWPSGGSGAVILSTAQPSAYRVRRHGRGSQAVRRAAVASSSEGQA